MELRLLGPVQALTNTGPVDLGTRRQRLVLAVLALQVNTLVPVDRLVDLCWSTDPPATARRVMQAHVSRLRAALTQPTGRSLASIVRHGAGYTLICDPQQVDAHRFRTLVDRARGLEDVDAVRVLREALALWRGPALADVVTDDIQSRLCAGLEEARLAAIEDRIDAELRLGKHHVLVDELTSLMAEHPYRERITCHLALALCRCGRTDAALGVCRAARQRAADELGTDPGPALQRLELDILRAAPGLNLPAPPDAVELAPLVPVTAQLPADIVDFTGRAVELARLSAVPTAPAASTGVTISVITGTAGVGKTALAVHWAHRMIHQFRDGQLYVNLRGFGPSGTAMPAAEALRGFLSALGVTTQRIPTELDAQVALYRSLLAGRRMLVLLDNARDAAQVRPLLPGAPECRVLVTSRSQLASLIAVDGAQPLTLDLLPEVDARRLLARRVGPRRAAAEPEAVGEIIAKCVGLPLALGIVAARAAVHPDFPLAALADELSQTRRLDVLATEDSTGDVAAVFSWSYNALSAPAARLFRRLGLHPGPDLAAPAAASLAGITGAEVRPLLLELTRANLVDEHRPGRYTFHDLLRVYAAELARTVDGDPERQRVIQRLLDHYLHTADQAALQLHPARDPIPLTGAGSEVTILRWTDRQHALAWFTAEHPVLLAVVNQAAHSGLDTHAWQLAWTLTTFLDRQGHWYDRLASHTTALAAARRLADPLGQSRMHQALANTYARLERLDDAHTHLRSALGPFRELGDANGQANVHLNLANVLWRQGRREQVQHHARAALELYRASGNRTGQARALHDSGWHDALDGNYARALASCQQALDLLQDLKDEYGQAGAWDSLGYINHHNGDHRQAVVCYQRSLDLLRDIGDLPDQAEVLDRLGDTHSAAGDPDAAHAAWSRALDIFDQIDHPEAGQIRAKLDGLHHPVP